MTMVTESVNDTGKCPKEYYHLNKYDPGDKVAVGLSVYECTTGPASQFCNIYSPEFAITTGGGSVGALGWMESQPCNYDSQGQDTDMVPLIGGKDDDQYADRPYRPPKKPSGLITSTRGIGWP